MKLLKILIGIAITLILVFFLGALLLPDRMTVERSTRIERPQAIVFALVNDLSRFNSWSPWYPLDPDATYRFEGPARGPGAAMHWSGDESVGSGTLRIVGNEPPARVRTEVAFEGFAEPAQAEFRIEPAGDAASTVTWTFDTALQGASARWFGLLMPGYIGEDYDRGLAALKREAEALPPVDVGALEVTEIQATSFDIIAIPGSAPADDMAAVSAVLGELYGQLVAFTATHGLEIAGQPLTLTADLPGDVWQFEAALPVRLTGPVDPSAPIEIKRTQAGPALVVEHVGPYDMLLETRARLDAYALAHGHRRAGPIQEIYVSDPADTPSEVLITRLVYPIEVD